MDYRGRRILDRAHAPIINVAYYGDRCGPFRDWGWQEGSFSAEGTDLANGLRLATDPPRTILESGTDEGVFNGVAIYSTADAVTLVSELNVGWYRYRSEWTLDADGEIHPRFGFSAVTNSCTCLLHFHNVYWRFDFDLDRLARDSVDELEYSSSGELLTSPLAAEGRRLRDDARQRFWRVHGGNDGSAFDLVPGSNDSSGDRDFGEGDVWFLRYHANEIDDGLGPNEGAIELTRAHLDEFLGSEALDREHVVAWYGVNAVHAPPEPAFILGPDIRPVAS